MGLCILDEYTMKHHACRFTSYKQTTITFVKTESALIIDYYRALFKPVTVTLLQHHWKCVQQHQFIRGCIATDMRIYGYNTSKQFISIFVNSTEATIALICTVDVI